MKIIKAIKNWIKVTNNRTRISNKIPDNKPVICVICSAGGHLTEALIALENFPYHFFIITYYLPHIEATINKWEHYFITNPHKNPLKYTINFIQSLFLFIKKSPDFIITTGSGMSVCFCFIGKIFGSKIIYIETGARVYNPSTTGKMMYYLSDLFIVQWKPLLKHFPKAVYGGQLLK